MQYVCVCVCVRVLTCDCWFSVSGDPTSLLQVHIMLLQLLVMLTSERQVMEKDVSGGRGGREGGGGRREGGKI